jgi:hypothetical protein
VILFVPHQPKLAYSGLPIDLTFQNCFVASLPPTLFRIFAPPGCSSTNPPISYTLLSTMMYRPLSTVLWSATSLVVNSFDIAEVGMGCRRMEGNADCPFDDCNQTVLRSRRRRLRSVVLKSRKKSNHTILDWSGRGGSNEMAVLPRLRSSIARTDGLPRHVSAVIWVGLARI